MQGSFPQSVSIKHEIFFFFVASCVIIAFCSFASLDVVAI